MFKADFHYTMFTDYHTKQYFNTEKREEPSTEFRLPKNNTLFLTCYYILTVVV